MADSSALALVNEFLATTKDHRWVLAAIKGLRNGIVYGCRIRAPHALVMVFLFGKGTLVEKLLTILKLTRTHAQNLGKFVFSYKLITGALEKLQNSREQWHSFVAAFVMGYFVFGDYNGVNMQINLYLLSRITLGLIRLAAEKGIIPKPNFPVFPWFGAIVWGIVLWLFEYHKDTLQPSLQNSMTYLYSDSNRWTSLIDWLWVNRLPVITPRPPPPS